MAGNNGHYPLRTDYRPKTTEHSWHHTRGRCCYIPILQVRKLSHREATSGRARLHSQACPRDVPRTTVPSPESAGDSAAGASSEGCVTSQGTPAPSSERGGHCPRTPFQRLGLEGAWAVASIPHCPAGGGLWPQGAQEVQGL